MKIEILVVSLKLVDLGEGGVTLRRHWIFGPTDYLDFHKQNETYKNSILPSKTCPKSGFQVNHWLCIDDLDYAS